MNLCQRCNNKKDLSEFFYDKDGTPSTVCKDCSYAKKRVDKVKDILEVVVGIGVGAVVGNAIRASTPLDARLYKKVCIIIGGHVISRMTADHAKVYTDKKIDGIVDKVRKVDEVAEKFKASFNEDDEEAEPTPVLSHERAENPNLS